MRPPTDAEVSDALDKLERTRMEIVETWKSDAERLNLPLVNTTTGTGAPLLDRDAVLRRSYPNYGRVK